MTPHFDPKGLLRITFFFNYFYEIKSKMAMLVKWNPRSLANMDSHSLLQMQNFQNMEVVFGLTLCVICWCGRCLRSWFYVYFEIIFSYINQTHHFFGSQFLSFGSWIRENL